MGTCAAKDSQISKSTLIDFEKEDQDVVLNEKTGMESYSVEEQLSKIKMNLTEAKRKNRSNRPSTQVLVRQKCLNNIDQRRTSNINTSKYISSINNNSSERIAISSNTTVPSLNFTSHNIKNNISCSPRDSPKSKSSNIRSSIISRQNSQLQPREIIKRNQNSKKISQTVIDQTNRYNNEHSKQLFRNRSQLSSPKQSQAINYLSLSNSSQASSYNSNKSSTFSANYNNLYYSSSTTTDSQSQQSSSTSSLEDLLHMLAKQNVSEDDILSLCDSFLDNKLKVLGESTQEFTGAVKDLALCLFKQQLPHLGKRYLDKLIVHRKECSQQAILKNLEDYSRKKR